MEYKSKRIGIGVKRTSKNKGESYISGSIDLSSLNQDWIYEDKYKDQSRRNFDFMIFSKESKNGKKYLSVIQVPPKETQNKQVQSMEPIDDSEIPF